MGAITSTVAALLRKGVTAMAAASSIASDPIGGSTEAVCDSQAAIKSVPPVVRNASLTGMSAPSMMRIGHSIAS